MARPHPLHVAVVACVVTACASSGAGSETSSRPPSAVSTRAQPLGALLGADRVVVLPTRFLANDLAGTWAAAAADTAATLAGLDDEIRFALTERGVGGQWIWPDQARRSAARSAGTVPEVGRLAAEPMVRLRADDVMTVPDPLRSQLRALGALNGARYVLYPLRLAMHAGPDGAGRATLRLALVDVRTATIEWIGDVSSDSQAAFGPTVTAGIASRVADLVVKHL